MDHTEKHRDLPKIILAASVGTLIEWYDFYLYGALAPLIAAQFFPPDNPSAAFLGALATFAAGFLVRPFGALVFGRLGDLIGRKHTFLVTLVLMGLSTFAIGFVPRYADIGLWAPAIILILRLVQGLALGGEYGGAATYVAEFAPEGRRGWYTSFIQTTATLGFFLSLGVILLTRQNFGLEKFNDWGWRVPFWISIFLVGISIYIRLRMAESPLFARIKREGKTSANPLRESFARKGNLKIVLLALFGAVMGQGVVWYTGQFYAQTFLERTCGVDFVQTRYVLCIAILAATPFFLVFGGLSDRIGRKPVMLAGMLLAVLAYRPIYSVLYALCGSGTATPGQWLEPAAFWAVTALVFVQILFVTMVYGPIAAFLVELFPTRIRYTSMSLPYHIGNGVFGGLTPFIATRLFDASKTPAQPMGDPLVGLWYPIGVAAVCFVIGWLYLPGKNSSIDVSLKKTQHE